MKKLISRFMVAAAFCAVMISVSCTKEDIIPVSTNMYNRLLPIWEQRESPRWHNTVEKYASHYGYTVIKDTVHVGSGNRTVTYLCQTDTLIYLLETWAINDTLWTLDCYLFAPTERWLKDQMVIFENEMYNRHPEGYTGGSFYWYTAPGHVDGGDVRSHDLFVQRAKEHTNDVWEWVEARTRYGLHPPYLGEDQLKLGSGGTRYTLDQLGLDAEHQIHQTLHIGFHTYDTTGWSNPYWFD